MSERQFAEIVELIKRTCSLSPAMVSDYKTKLPDKRILQKKLHELFENGTLTMNINEKDDNEE